MVFNWPVGGTDGLGCPLNEVTLPVWDETRVSADQAAVAPDGTSDVNPSTRPHRGQDSLAGWSPEVSTRLPQAGQIRISIEPRVGFTTPVRRQATFNMIDAGAASKQCPPRR